MASPKIVIIGAGVSGICLGIRLKLAGIDSFTILEKSDGSGGVWNDNTYPGAGCDIPSFLYSFSFAPKTDWKRRYARQPEILEYFRDCAERFEITSHIEFGATVTSAEYNEKTSTWAIRTSDGETRNAAFLVTAAGQLSRPRIPEFEGLGTFGGPAFHSARWDHDFDFEGRAVAVIGSAASAVQLLPHLAKKARRVVVFQRSPNWISRFRDTEYSGSSRWMFRRIPGAARIHRWWLFWRHEWRILLNGKSTILNGCMTRWLRRSMRRRVPDSRWCDLIPDYPAGCKRILLSNEYLETIQRKNVRLVTDPINRITEDAIETASASHRVDAIVFATGFESGQFLAPIEIIGRNAENLQKAWDSPPRAWLGMLTPGFPNFFMLYGPNTNLAHNSIIFMVECQVNFLIRCLKKMIAESDREIEIESEAADLQDRKLREVLESTVWTAGCGNWYKTEDGEVVNNWGSSAVSYWWQTNRADLRTLRFTGKPGRSDR